MQLPSRGAIPARPRSTVLFFVQKSHSTKQHLIGPRGFKNRGYGRPRSRGSTIRLHRRPSNIKKSINKCSKIIVDFTHVDKRGKGKIRKNFDFSGPNG